MCIRDRFKAYFDRVLTSEDFAESKPHPDCYLKGAAYFGVEPEDCIGAVYKRQLLNFRTFCPHALNQRSPAEGKGKGLSLIHI